MVYNPTHNPVSQDPFSKRQQVRKRPAESTLVAELPSDVYAPCCRVGIRTGARLHK